MSNELRPVVTADEGRSWLEPDELLQHRHHIYGLATPSQTDRLAQAAVLVDHVQELEPPSISGGIELDPSMAHTW